MKTLFAKEQLALLLGYLFILLNPSLYAQELRKDSVRYFQFQTPNDSLITNREICTYSNYASGSICYNFKSCISSRFDPFDRIWIAINKEEERIEEDGQRRYIIFSRWNEAENRWVNTRKELFYESPETEWKERYEWEPINNNWLKLNEDYLYFNKAKQVILSESKYYQKDGNTWTGSREEKKYDTNGFLAENIQANWSEEFDKWILDRKIEYEKDSQGRAIIERTYAWEEDTESWRNFWNLENTYTDEGLPLRRVATQLPSAFRFIEEFTYDDLGQELTYLSFTQSPGSGDLVSDRRRLSQYTPANKISLSESSVWDPAAEEWKPESRKEYSYDQEDRETRRREYRSSFGISSLLLDQVHEKAYAADGKLIAVRVFRYDEIESIRSANQTTYEYDDQDRNHVSIIWRWDSELEEFYRSRKSENPYNADGSIEYYSSFDWDRNEEKWVGNALVGFTDDPQAPIARLFRGVWNPVSESWFINLVTYTYRGSCRLEEALDAPSSDLSFYPNPVADGSLSLEMPIDKSYSYTIMDLQGRSILEGEVGGPFGQIEVGNTPTGIYLIRFTHGDEEILERLMVQNP